MIVFLDKSVVYIYTHLVIVDMYAVKRYHYGVLLFYLILAAALYLYIAHGDGVYDLCLLAGCRSRELACSRM